MKVLSGIWFARNKKNWEEKDVDSSIAMEMSVKQITDWQVANRRRLVSTM